MKSVLCAMALVFVSSFAFAAEPQEKQFCNCVDMNETVKGVYDGKDVCRMHVMCAYAVACKTSCSDPKNPSACSKTETRPKCFASSDSCPSAQACVDHREKGFTSDDVAWDGKPAANSVKKSPEIDATPAAAAATGSNQLTNPLQLNTTGPIAAPGTPGAVGASPLHDGTRPNRGRTFNPTGGNVPPAGTVPVNGNK